MHPFCRCAIAAAMDQDEYEKWLNEKAEAQKMLTKIEAEDLNNSQGLRSSGLDKNVPEHDPPKFIRKLLDSENRREVLLSYEKRIADSELENAIVITKDGEVYHCLRGIDYLFEYELDRNAENIDSDQINVFDADEYSYRHSMVITEAHKYGFGYRRIHRR